MKKDSLEIELKDCDLETIFLITYYYVDELYQQMSHLVSRPGPRPVFTDSEVISVNLVGQMMSDSEKAWHSYVSRNYSKLFPDLIERSRYHRRCKDLMQLTNLMRVVLLRIMKVHTEPWHIMDSMPIPVCVYVRAGRNDRFAIEFGIDKDTLFGYCASKKEKVYGFKLHLMVSVQGIPVHFVLAAAAHHDVKVAPNLIDSYRPNIDIGSDKGYVGLFKRLENPEQYHLIIPPKDNQENYLTQEEKHFLKQYRSIVETTNSLLAGQFNIQFTRAISKRGLMSRITAKLTSLTIAIFINFLAGNDLLHVKQLIF